LVGFAVKKGEDTQKKVMACGGENSLQVIAVFKLNMIVSFK